MDKKTGLRASAGTAVATCGGEVILLGGVSRDPSNQHNVRWGCYCGPWPHRMPAPLADHWFSAGGGVWTVVTASPLYKSRESPEPTETSEISDSL